MKYKNYLYTRFVSNKNIVRLFLITIARGLEGLGIVRSCIEQQLSKSYSNFTKNILGWATTEKDSFQ